MVSDRNSIAPAFIARTEEGISPWPVMKMIGGASPPASSRWSSRPLTSGSCRSRTRQEGASGFSNSRNSAAEPNAATRNPTDEIRLHSASRTRGSSSTKKTMGLSGVTVRYSHGWEE